MTPKDERRLDEAEEALAKLLEDLMARHGPAIAMTAVTRIVVLAAVRMKATRHSFLGMMSDAYEMARRAEDEG
jgi:hypothetical protein